MGPKPPQRSVAGHVSLRIMMRAPELPKICQSRLHSGSSGLQAADIRRVIIMSTQERESDIKKGKQRPWVEDQGGDMQCIYVKSKTNQATRVNSEKQAYLTPWRPFRTVE